MTTSFNKRVLVSFRFVVVTCVLSVHHSLFTFLLGVIGRLPVSILYKSIAGRYRPVSYPDGPITARYRFIQIYLLNVVNRISFSSILQI